MASNIRFKRSSVTGKSPSAVQLPIGEIAMNTKDGVLWMQEEGARILNIRAGSALTAGRFIYVSPHGDDTNNDGSDRLKAKKTVSGAVATMKDINYDADTRTKRRVAYILHMAYGSK